MKIRSAHFSHAVFLPNGGGAKGDYVREHAFDIVQEGGFLRLRVKDKKDGQVVSVPMANVACFEAVDMPWPEAPAPAAAKPKT